MSEDKKYWVVSGFFTLMQRFGVQFFGLAMAPILFRSFSKSDMGDWVIFLTAVSILEVGRIGLQQNALIKYLTTAEDEASYRSIATASFALNLMVTGIMVILLWLIAPLTGEWFNSASLPTMFRIYCLTTILLVPFLQFNYMGQANLDFKGMFWSDFVRQGMLFFFILFTFLAGGELTLVGLAKVQLLTAVVASVVAGYFAKRYLRFNRFVDWEQVNELFQYGKFVLGTNLSAMLYKTIDKFMLGGLLGSAATASYDAAIKVTNMADIPTNSMASILFPQSARRINNGKSAVKELYEKAVGAIFALLIPGIVTVLIFAETIIVLLAGADYADSAGLLRLTILYGLFIPYAVQFGTVLDSIGKPKINFWFTGAGALLNVVLNFVFIMNFGIYGAVYGTLITYLITFFFMQRLLYKMFGIQAWAAFKYMFDFYGQIKDILIGFFLQKKSVNDERLKDASL